MTCPNPIFEKWLIEWSEFHRSKNSLALVKYDKALNALQQHSSILKTGADCKRLNNFDPSICQDIDERMKAEGIYPAGQHDSGSADTRNIALIKPSGSKDVGSTLTSSGNTDKKKSSSSLTFRADDAILLALIQKEQYVNYRGFMTKTELKQEAQRYCVKSFTKSAGKLSRGTAWQSIHKLIADKYIVAKNQCPVQYVLTDEGRNKAKSILDRSNLPQPGLKLSGECCFLPGDFEVVLLVNSRQVEGRQKSRKPLMTSKFEEFKISFDTSHLRVGEFVWVVRETNSSNVNSLVLPYVVEYIQMCDLDSSIEDVTYQDTKERIKATKFQGIYVIESRQGEQSKNADEKKKKIIISALEKKYGFWTKETTSFEDTLEYLAQTTIDFVNYYKKKTFFGYLKSQHDELGDVDVIDEAHLMYFSDFNDYFCKGSRIDGDDVDDEDKDEFVAGDADEEEDEFGADDEVFEDADYEDGSYE